MRSASGLLTALICSAISIFGSNGSEPQKVFRTPDAALHALVVSFEKDNYLLFVVTAGPEMKDLWSTGDAARDALDRERLLDELHHTRFQEVPGYPERILVRLGDRGEPFPAPLVMSSDGWRFDDKTGAVEIAKRRIRRNEWAAIDQCSRYVEAQFEYAKEDHGAGAGVFAERIRARPGLEDGLFWANDGAVDESPSGPMFAQAAFSELGGTDRPRPYFGYYFKILLKQGGAAHGGSKDYRVNGKLLRGFALIAWPAEYGISGRESFLVNHNGEIYQKDLGTETSAIATRADEFNPDDGWTRVLPDIDYEH